MSIGRLTAAVVAVGKAMDETAKKADALGDQLADLAEADSLTTISENLRRLFASEDLQGNPFSAAFDKDTGRMTGGAFSDKYIAGLFRDLAESMISTKWANNSSGLTANELRQRNIDPVFLRQDYAKSIAFIERIAGNRFGNVERTLKELIETLKKMAQKETQDRSRATSATRPASSTSTSPITLQLFGWLP